MTGESSTAFEGFGMGELQDHLLNTTSEGLSSIDGGVVTKTSPNKNSLVLDNTITSCFLMSSILNTILYVIGFLALSNKLKMSYRSLKMGAIVFTIIAHVLLLLCSVAATKKFIQRDKLKKNNRHSVQQVVKIVGTTLVGAMVIFSSVVLLRSMLLMYSPPHFLPIIGCVSDVLYTSTVFLLLYLGKKSLPEKACLKKEGPLDKVETSLKVLCALLGMASICAFFVNRYASLNKSGGKYVPYAEFAITLAWIFISVTSLALSHTKQPERDKKLFDEKLFQEKSLLKFLRDDLIKPHDNTMKLRRLIISELLSEKKEHDTMNQQQPNALKNGTAIRVHNERHNNLKWMVPHYR